MAIESLRSAMTTSRISRAMDVPRCKVTDINPSLFVSFSHVIFNCFLRMGSAKIRKFQGQTPYCGTAGLLDFLSISYDQHV